MVLPEVGDWLEEIVYVGATEEEAKEIIKTYNAAGKAAGYGSERRFSKDRWNYNRSEYYLNILCLIYLFSIIGMKKSLVVELGELK